MKLTQPEDQETVYYIKEYNEELDTPIHVAFNNYETASAYVNRFRTMGDDYIIECRLNPVFYTDITRDCYFILLNEHNDEATTYRVTDLQRTELAFNGHYFFEGEQICIYVMAVTQGEAIKAAREIKQRVTRNQG
jgi:predicted GIY-YIG superfamily endonuclease